MKLDCDFDVIIIKLIYDINDKNYKLEMHNARGKFYINDRLVFQGFAYKAIKMFIDNFNDDKVH